MTSDTDTGVSFSALRSVAFYCAVNTSTYGPFLDEHTCTPSFLAAAQNHSALLNQLDRVRAQCGDHFGQQLKLLALVLSEVSSRNGI